MKKLLAILMALTMLLMTGCSVIPTKQAPTAAPTEAPTAEPTA